MKRFVFIVCWLLPSFVFCQQLTYDQWKEEAKKDMTRVPEYGNAPKSKEQKEADEKFIRVSVKEDGSRQSASQHMVDVGFQSLNAGDLRAAMVRFNQAWLLNPKNENAYWGFGAVYFMFSDFDSAMKQYEKGLLINPRSSNLITDKATIYMTVFNSKQDKSYLNTAIDLLLKSYAIDSQNQNTLVKLSGCYFFAKDCPNALKYFKECKKLGGTPITWEYEKALTNRCGK